MKGAADFASMLLAVTFVLIVAFGMVGWLIWLATLPWRWLMSTGWTGL